MEPPRCRDCGESGCGCGGGAVAEGGGGGGGDSLGRKIPLEMIDLIKKFIKPEHMMKVDEMFDYFVKNVPEHFVELIIKLRSKGISNKKSTVLDEEFNDLFVYIEQQKKNENLRFMLLYFIGRYCLDYPNEKIVLKNSPKNVAKFVKRFFPLIEIDCVYKCGRTCCSDRLAAYMRSIIRERNNTKNIGYCYFFAAMCTTNYVIHRFRQFNISTEIRDIIVDTIRFFKEIKLAPFPMFISFMKECVRMKLFECDEQFIKIFDFCCIKNNEQDIIKKYATIEKIKYLVDVKRIDLAGKVLNSNLHLLRKADEDLLMSLFENQTSRFLVKQSEYIKKNHLIKLLEKMSMKEKKGSFYVSIMYLHKRLTFFEYTDLLDREIVMKMRYVIFGDYQKKYNEFLDSEASFDRIYNEFIAYGIRVDFSKFEKITPSSEIALLKGLWKPTNLDLLNEKSLSFIEKLAEKNPELEFNGQEYVAGKIEKFRACVCVKCVCGGEECFATKLGHFMSRHLCESLNFDEILRHITRLHAGTLRISAKFFDATFEKFRYNIEIFNQMKYQYFGLERNAIFIERFVELYSRENLWSLLNIESFVEEMLYEPTFCLGIDLKNYHDFRGDGVRKNFLLMSYFYRIFMLTCHVRDEYPEIYPSFIRKYGQEIVKKFAVNINNIYKTQIVSSLKIIIHTMEPRIIVHLKNCMKRKIPGYLSRELFE